MINWLTYLSICQGTLLKNYVSRIRPQRQWSLTSAPQSNVQIPQLSRPVDFRTSSQNHGPATKHLWKTSKKLVSWEYLKADWVQYTIPWNPVNVQSVEYGLQSRIPLVSASPWLQCSLLSERTALRLQRINTTSGSLVALFATILGMAAGRSSTPSAAQTGRSFDPSIYRGKSRASLKTFAGQTPNWHQRLALLDSM